MCTDYEGIDTNTSKTFSERPKDPSKTYSKIKHALLKIQHLLPRDASQRLSACIYAYEIEVVQLFLQNIKNKSRRVSWYDSLTITVLLNAKSNNCRTQKIYLCDKYAIEFNNIITAEFDVNRDGSDVFGITGTPKQLQTLRV